MIVLTHFWYLRWDRKKSLHAFRLVYFAISFSVIFFEGESCSTCSTSSVKRVSWAIMVVILAFEAV